MLRAACELELLETRRLLSTTFVKDINPSLSYIGVPASAVTDVNGTLYFNFNVRLYKTDGSANGMAQVHPGVYTPTELTNLNGQLLFNGGGQLMTSDGTEPGTVAIVPAGMNPRDVTVAGSRVFFRGADGGGDELWTSDGTVPGTYRVKDINPGGASSSPRGFVAVGSRVFFHADDPTSGDELWTSDGTDGGTYRVKDILPGGGSSGPSFLTNVGGTLFFTATDGTSGYELWKSDGTDAGTVRVKDIRPGAGGSTPTQIVNVAGAAMFIADDGASGFEIWKSDGTGAGTTMVRDIVPGGAGAQVNHLTAVGSTLYFTADDGTSGQELWKSDGTAAGTTLVKNIGGGSSASDPLSLTAFGNKLFFTASNGSSGAEPWISDGTDAGTFLLKDIQPGFGSSSVNSVAVVGNKVYFNASGADGAGLWVSDGTSAGTHFVQAPSGYALVGSDLSQFININGVGYFAANDGVHGQELWRSDGTSAGTQMVADLNPGAGGTGLDSFINFNGTLFFRGDGWISKSDGTAAGTVHVSPAPVFGGQLAAAGATLYFTGNSSAGNGLWKSDGTTAGTTLVKSLDVNAWKPDSLIGLANGSAMFIADDGVHGVELWKSDGTAGGTTLVRDIISGSGSSGPLLLTNVNGTVFFRANDGVNGYELWKTDGTAAGTAMVKDIRAGADGSVVSSLINVAGTLFFTADDGVHGDELWKSDGTAAGTVMVKDIYAGRHGSSPGSLTVSGGLLYFRGDDGIAGNELWKSDGTAAGTVMVKDINPGPAGSGLGHMYPLGAQGVVFVANDNVHGYATWQSDGTAAGSAFTYPFSIDQGVGIGNSVLISAWSDGGMELSEVDLTTPATTAPAAQIAPPQTTTASSAPSPSAPPAGSGIVYDATFLGDRPDLSQFGVLPFIIDYNSYFASYLDQTQADESAVRALAQQAASRGVPICLNLETWPNDIRFASESVVGQSVEKLMQIVDWMHDERPDVKVGYAGMFPHGAYLPPAIGTATYEQWHAANERLRPLANKVDLFFPGIYAQDDSVDNWLAYARGHVAEASLFAKPVYPLIFMNYEGGGQWNQSVAPEFWRTMLDETRRLSGVAVVWGGWSDDASWDVLTRDFVANPDPMAPAAPTALAAAADQANLRIDLTWQDHAYNESGYRVERHPAGQTSFVTVASLPADSTSWSDTTATPGYDYIYRVFATNVGGDSIPTSEVAMRIRIVPAAPSDVTAVALASRRTRITWSEAGDDVQNFIVERSSGGSFAPVATIAGDVYSCDDGGLTPGTAYAYRVRASNAIGQSAPSPQADVTTPFTDTAIRAHWALDETGGSTAGDSSGAGHVGAFIGGPVTAGGELGPARIFDGVDDHVVVPDAADLRFTSGDDFSISLWVNLASLPNKWSAVLVKGSGGGTYGIWLDSTNHWIVGAEDTFAGPVATTGWTYLTVVQDAAAGRRVLYVNGVQVAAGFAGDANASGALWIGGNPSDASQFFPGRIDDVRIYGKALTASDAAALANPNVTLAGGAGDDLWTISLSAAGDTYQFSSTAAGGNASFTRPIDAVGSISVIGGAGDDQLIIDCANGDPLPLYGFTFDGGGASGNDTLTLRGDVTDLFNITGATIQRSLGSITYSNVETLDLSQGQFAFPTDFASMTSELRVDTGAVALFNTSQHLNFLNVAGSASLSLGSPKLLMAKSLSITNAGRLDLTDNALAIDYSGGSVIGTWNGNAYAGVSGLVASGRQATGAWDGVGIVTSLSSAIDPNSLTTLGVAEASDALGISASETTLWNGGTIDGTTVIVKYTYSGDANLDGVINGDDYFAIDSAFPQSAHGYENGDFNFDGVVNGDDYFLIDSTFPQQGSPL